MASNARKQGGRTTAKGTQPQAKKPRGGPGGAAAGPGGGKGAVPEQPTVNRQMRRSGIVPEQPDPEPAMRRLKMSLIIGGAVLGVLTILFIVLFGLSGTWIGLLGAAAGVLTGLAVTTGKTFAADKGKPIAIGLLVLGALVEFLSLANVVDIHWSFLAFVGCGAGAFVAFISAQQMTAPPDPPSSALALLRQRGAQQLPTAGGGNCVWATPDGRIRVIVGATPAANVTGDTIAKDRSVTKARQQAVLLTRRLAAAGVEDRYICVVDAAIPTTRDGDATICSVSGLGKVLGRGAR